MGEGAINGYVGKGFAVEKYWESLLYMIDKTDPNNDDPWLFFVKKNNMFLN